MKKAWVMVVCLFVLSACGDRDQNTSTGNEGKEGVPVNVHPDQRDVLNERLKASLALMKRENHTYQFEYVVANNSNQSVHITFNSGQKFDYLLRNEAGEIIKRGSEGKFFTQALIEQDIEPGAQLSFEIVLEDLAPGNYLLEAWLTAGSEASDYKQLLKFTVE